MISYPPAEPVIIKDSDFRPSTEKDSPYFGQDMTSRWISPIQREIHEQYCTGKVQILDPKIAWRMYNQINAEMERVHRDLAVKAVLSEEAASRIVLTD